MVVSSGVIESDYNVLMVICIISMGTFLVEISTLNRKDAIDRMVSTVSVITCST